MKIATILFACAAVGLAQPPRTVLDGVFSEAQAKRGKQAYRSQCQGCHGPNLEGTGVSQPLRAQAFLDLWREEDLGKLFEYTQANMPVDDPGSLDSKVYLDVLAFLLEGNGFPTGKADLTEEQLSRILLVGPGGPQPLPKDLLVRLVGCLARDGDAWKLTSATHPKRFRASDHVNEAELGRSGDTPLGEGTFRLREAGPGASALDGRRVQVKGTLSGDSVTVMSLERTGGGCAAQ